MASATGSVSGSAEESNATGCKGRQQLQKRSQLEPKASLTEDKTRNLKKRKSSEGGNNTGTRCLTRIGPKD